MKSTARVYPPARAALLAATLFMAFGVDSARAQNEPILVPEAIEYQKLLPILPEPLPGWTADKPEGSTEDVGGFETFEKDTRHATLWVMIANRYFVQVELQNEDPGELREWIKHIDLKKLAEI